MPKTYRQLTEELEASETRNPRDFAGLLHGKFIAWNREFFDNRIPKIPINFAPLKGVGGVCQAKFIRKSNEPTRGFMAQYSTTRLVPGSMSITMSTNYKRTQDQVLGIFLHEMIHAWFNAQDRGYVSHDLPFLQKRNELKDKVPFEIPVTEEQSDLETTDEVRPKDIGAVLWGRNGQPEAYMLFNKSLSVSDVIIFAEKRVGTNGWFEIYRGPTKVYQRGTVVTKLGYNTSRYKASDQALGMIKQDMKLLHRHTLEHEMS